MEERLKKYIKDAIESGADRSEIEETLRNAGWDQNKINNTFLEIEAEKLQPKPFSEEPSQPEPSQPEPSQPEPFQPEPSQPEQFQRSVPSIPSTQEMQPQKDRKGCAIASLVLGLLSCSGVTVIPGIILGILGLKSSKKGLAIAGIVLSIVGLLIVSIILIFIFWGIKYAKIGMNIAKLKQLAKEVAIASATGTDYTALTEGCGGTADIGGTKVITTIDQCDTCTNLDFQALCKEFIGKEDILKLAYTTTSSEFAASIEMLVTEGTLKYCIDESKSCQTDIAISNGATSCQCSKWSFK